MDGDHYRISSCDMWVCTVPYCAIGRCKQVDLCFIGSSAASCHYNAIHKICAHSQLFLTVGGHRNSDRAAEIPVTEL